MTTAQHRAKERPVANATPLDEAKDLQKMLVDYAKQETIDPFKTLGGYLAWGIAGALAMFLGLFFFGLGTLRLLQAEFDGNSWLSLLPYLAAIVLLIAAIAGLVLAFNRAKNRVLS